jgi:hypothetical protein
MCSEIRQAAAVAHHREGIIPWATSRVHMKGDDEVVFRHLTGQRSYDNSKYITVWTFVWCSRTGLGQAPRPDRMYSSGAKNLGWLEQLWQTGRCALIVSRKDALVRPGDLLNHVADLGGCQKLLPESVKQLQYKI